MVDVGHPALPHGATRLSRWLRARRVRIALWSAVLEGILVVFDVIPEWIALVVAAAIILFYLFVGRNVRRDEVRQTSWIAALSQVLLALVPVLLFFLTALAVVALAALALVAIAALLADRR